MRIVETLERRRGDPPGPEAYATGDGRLYVLTGRNRGQDCFRRAERRAVGLPRACQRVVGHNFIVAATLRPEGDCFIDADTGWPYLSADASFHSILNGVLTGALRREAGGITGLFTFTLHNWGPAFMAIRAHAAAPPAGALDTPADAEDLSDFIKGLKEP